MGIITELKRRNVLRVGAAYIVTAWLVIQVVETIFPAFGFGDTAVRYVTIAFAVGLVPALIIAWVFELTPEGLKRDSEISDERSVSKHAAKRLDRAILLILALALGYFAFDKFLLAPEREERLQQQQEEELAKATEAARQEGRSEAFSKSFGDQSIAVLPFVNMSSDPEQEYFSDGISEEILNVLARMPDLRVISRSSSFAYKDREIEVPEIGRLLNVAHVLEGSVRRSGNTVRITAQLIEANSDTHLWSETWDREFKDIFAIQDEIAHEVSERLQLTLAGGTQVSNGIDPMAHELLLRGRYLLNDFVPEKARRAEALLQESIAIEPDYAPAHAGLAEAYRQIYVTSAVELDLEKGHMLMAQEIARALALDPEESQALALKGYLLSFGAAKPDIEAASEQWQKAIQSNPSNADALRWLSFVYQGIDPLKGLELMRRAYRVDPLRPVLNLQLAGHLISFGLFDEAMQMAKNYHRTNPDDWRAYQVASWILSLQGAEADAMKVWYRAYQLEPGAFPYSEFVWFLIDFMQAPAELTGAWIDHWKASAGESYFSRGSDVVAELAYLRLSGNEERAIELAERNFEAGVIDTDWFAYFLLRGTRDYSRARALYEEAYSPADARLSHFDPEGMSRWDMYVDYALILKHTGNAEAALSLAGEIHSHVDFLRGQGVIFGPAGSVLPFLEAEVLAIENRREEAIEALRSATGLGRHVCGACLRVFPHFDELRELGEFQAVVRDVDARNAAVIERLKKEGMFLKPEELLARQRIEFDPFGQAAD